MRSKRVSKNLKRLNKSKSKMLNKSKSKRLNKSKSKRLNKSKSKRLSKLKRGGGVSVEPFIDYAGFHPGKEIPIEGFPWFQKPPPNDRGSSETGSWPQAQEKIAEALEKSRLLSWPEYAKKMGLTLPVRDEAADKDGNFVSSTEFNNFKADLFGKIEGMVKTSLGNIQDLLTRTDEAIEATEGTTAAGTTATGTTATGTTAAGTTAAGTTAAGGN